MPFTPFHMGPGILMKALLQGSFSLTIFGWTQIVMDIQPLIVLITGDGHLHGFTHTFVGATLIALFSALSGKYLSELGLKMIDIPTPNGIAWWVAFLSAFIGSFSHVVLDGIMHHDVEPFFPFTKDNEFLGLMTVDQLHKLCVYSAGLGALLYFTVVMLLKRRSKPD